MDLFLTYDNDDMYKIHANDREGLSEGETHSGMNRDNEEKTNLNIFFPFNVAFSLLFVLLYLMDTYERSNAIAAAILAIVHCLLMYIIQIKCDKIENENDF